MQPNSGESSLAVILHGRVQGVGFRWWTCRQASAIGIRGTVRNLPDGSVEVRAAGPDDALTRFLGVLRRGPPGARVDTTEFLHPTGDLPPDFRAIY